MATNDKQTNVQLIRKFDDWEYSWWSSLNQRMPWFDAKGTGTKALLTTSSSPTNYPSGSIIWAGTDRYPADWISAVGMRNPGVIWYWVNEDDCDEDRKPGRMFPSYFFFKQINSYISICFKLINPIQWISNVKAQWRIQLSESLLYDASKEATKFLNLVASLEAITI